MNSKLVVLSAPSGVGKSTVCRELLKKNAALRVSISYTTRMPRGTERDGKEYHFVGDNEFDRMIEANKFLEWAPVHGCRYGTAKADVEELLAQGKWVLFDVDVQGGQQIKKAIPSAQLVFLLPPSFGVLKERLVGRGTENGQKVAQRLSAAAMELQQGKAYDVHWVNDQLDKTVEELDAWIRNPRPQRHDQLLEHLYLQATSKHL